MLTDRIKGDLKSALKAGDSERVGVLRMLISEINNKEKEKFSKDGVTVLGDEEVISVLQKESKKRKDAVELFKQGGRDDLATKEEKEISVIDLYLPEQASEEEIEKVVGECVGDGATEFGQIMRGVSAKLKGRADGKKISEIVKKKLGK